MREIVRPFGRVPHVYIRQDAELDLLNVPNLGEMIRHPGMEWFHFGIGDGVAPDQRFVRQ